MPRHVGANNGLPPGDSLLGVANLVETPRAAAPDLERVPPHRDGELNGRINARQSTEHMGRSMHSWDGFLGAQREGDARVRRPGRFRGALTRFAWSIRHGDPATGWSYLNQAQTMLRDAVTAVAEGGAGLALTSPEAGEIIRRLGSSLNAISLGPNGERTYVVSSAILLNTTLQLQREALDNHDHKPTPEQQAQLMALRIALGGRTKPVRVALEHGTTQAVNELLAEYGHGLPDLR